MREMEREDELGEEMQGKDGGEEGRRREVKRLGDGGGGERGEIEGVER